MGQEVGGCIVAETPPHPGGETGCFLIRKLSSANVHVLKMGLTEKNGGKVLCGEAPTTWDMGRPSSVRTKIH